MSGILTPTPKFTGLDDEGIILPGGLLYTYLAGTTTPAVTYTDSDLLVPNANPIVLDSAGRAVIYLGGVSYKFILKDSTGALVWSQDNISTGAAASGGSGVGEAFVFGGAAEVPITATTYPTGFVFTALHAGTGVWSVDSDTLTGGTYALEGILASIDGIITVTVGLFDLDDGAPDTPIAEISTIIQTGTLLQSSSITFATAGAAKRYGIKAKVSAGSGYAWGLRVMRVA